MKKRNKELLIILIIGFVLILSLFIVDYIKKEIETYDLYNDYTRANQVMTLSFNKNFDLQFMTIRIVESSTSIPKESKGSLIYDYAQYEIIPILKYLEAKSESEILINSFSEFCDFLANFNSAFNKDRESILVRNSHDKYYEYKDGVYTYQINKAIITKESFNKLYSEYMQINNNDSVLDNFLKCLYEYDTINNNYSFNELKKVIINDYEEFYKENEEIIIEVISNDLSKFTNYLNTFYIEVDESGGNPPKMKKDIDTEYISLNYRFTKLDRIYVSYSKYYLYSYQLDLNDVWNQLADLDLPKLYM